MLAKIYCDGASSNNQDATIRVGGYAAVVYLKLEDGRVFERSVGDKVLGATNNQMELKAILEGLKSIPEGNRTKAIVTIESDSAYAVNIFTKWLQGWKSNGWKKKKGDIENLSIIQEIDSLLPSYKKVNILHAKRCSNQWLSKADGIASAYAGSRS